MIFFIMFLYWACVITKIFTPRSHDLKKNQFREFINILLLKLNFSTCFYTNGTKHQLIMYIIDIIIKKLNINYIENCST